MRFELRREWLVLTLLLALLSACNSLGAASSSAVSTMTGEGARAVELNVFAAASLTEAFEEIGASFEAANPGVSVNFNFAGSQQLAQQIAQGAPTDVFASANQAQMEAVIESGDVASGSERVFARNRLVVIYPAENPAGLETLQDLARPGVKLVLAAAEVPVGQYALEFFEKASADTAFPATFQVNALGNVVSYEENVRAVLSKVALGEADAGIVYSSDVAAESEAVRRIEIPDALNSVASYPIAIISGSPQAEAAQAFVDYALSAEGQEALARHGFLRATK